MKRYCLIAFVLLGVLGLMLVGAQAFGQGPAPKPALERMPTTRYIAPPTPMQRAWQVDEMRSNMVARRAWDAAASNLLSTIGRQQPTNWQGRIRAAKALEATAAVIKALPKTTRDRFITNQTERMP